MIRASCFRVLLLVGLLSVSGCEPASDMAEEAVVDVAAQLTQLYHEYDEEVLALNPVLRYLARLLEIDSSSLDVQDRLNHDIFQLDRENAIERHDQGYDEFESLTPVSQFFSVPNFLVMLGSGATAQPFNTPEDYDNWIARSSGFVGHVDLAITKMREGVELEIVQPRILMEKALPQLAAQVVEDPEQSDFWQPIANMPDTFPDEERQRITTAYREHIRQTARLHKG